MSLALLPPLTDLFALTGLALVLCAWVLRLSQQLSLARSWAGWLLAGLLVLLWIPVGTAAIPVVAYVRGISSDLSITLIALACLALWRGFGGARSGESDHREMRAVFVVVGIAATCLYPLALGWGNWDVYRPGWGSYGMLFGLLVAGSLALSVGLRLLPLLLALALLAWTAGLMESRNLWDYLLDPWLAFASLYKVLKMGVAALRDRVGRRLLPGDVPLFSKTTP